MSRFFDNLVVAYLLFGPPVYILHLQRLYEKFPNLRHSDIRR